MVVCLLAAVAVMTGCAQKKETGRAVIDQVRINEVMSANSYYLPLPDKSCYDWIEFTNTSDEAVNLKGCYLSDNGKMPRKWEIPTDLAIEPGGYGIVYLSGLNMTDEYGNIHANFKLSSKGETLVFSNAAGDVIQQISIPESGVSNISYGYDSAAEDYAWFAEPSPGRENSGATSRTPETLVFPPSGVVINEYMTKNTYVIYDSNNCYCDWVELYNTTDSDVSLNGYSLSDRQEGGRWFFPEDAVIGAGGYLLVFCSDQTSAVPGEYHTGFGLSAGETLSLYSIAGQQVDSVTLGDLNPNVSCGRDPESGEFRLFASPTPGGANTSYSFALTAAVSAAPYSPVFVSEALCVSDKDGDFKNDFIEIHNTSANAVSLSGYGLSKSAEGAAFVFPDVTLAPGGYAVVYCSGKNVSKKGKTMQAAFKLNQGGEDIWLFDDGGHIIDIFPSGKQTAGHSSGRVDSRKNEVVVFEMPTPGQSNGGITTYAGYAPSPVFSSGGGYVPSGFQFTVAAPEDCTVYYTTDGQMPTSASHKYKGPITVVKSTVVRAVAYRAGYLPSQMTTATFLVEKEHTVPVVSVISDPAGLFSRATGIMSSEKGGLVPGGSNYYSTEEREITFEYYVGGKRAVSFEAMTRMFGETSRKEKQKSLAVLLSEKCGANEVYFPFFGNNAVGVFSSFVLRPSGQDWKRAHMRDELCSRLIRGAMECDYMEAQPMALYINGEYWGLYYLREKLNEDYLVHKYNMTKGQIDIVKWERKTQAGSRDDYLALCDYCETHDLTVKKHYDYVCSQIDVDSLMDWWIFETYVANDDTGNIRCYRDRNDGKWHWMLFDLDYAFSLVNYKNNYIKRYMLGSTHGLAKCNNAIPRNLLKNSDFREKFILRYFHHVKTTFAPDRVIAVMDQLSDEIKDEMPRQAERWGEPTVSYWNYNKKTIKQIINKKPELAKAQIKEAFRLSQKKVDQYYEKA